MEAKFSWFCPKDRDGDPWIRGIEDDSIDDCHCEEAVGRRGNPAFGKGFTQSREDAEESHGMEDT